MAAPPSYQDAEAGVPYTDNQPPPGPVASFGDLALDATPRDPDPNTCLAHLRLLFAFQGLKEDVGYADGLWGLWDTREDGDAQKTKEGKVDVKEKVPVDAKVPTDSKREVPNEKHLLLSKIREKRWALYVARAVDRYEAWWRSLSEGPGLNEDAMNSPDSPTYAEFPNGGQNTNYWAERALPPLDVLLVYHSHMLNPYNFLEDCLRAGYRQFWGNGMPWHLVNAAIDANFNYNVSDDLKARWVAQTGRAWENSDDPDIKTIPCPVCTATIEVPWTTCGLEEYPSAGADASLTGSGYGDGNLDVHCHSCGTHITKEFLSLAKFCNDSRDLLVKNLPMPGTVLDPMRGEPLGFTPASHKPWNPQTFPNRMIKLVLRIEIQDLLRTPTPGQPRTMEDVRKMIEDVLSKQSALRVIDQGTTTPRSLRPARPLPVARLSVRKMMSRYWENFSPFALDLCGAVLRQGIFSDKMYKIDWLHSPAARETMARICVKYQRFVAIMADNGSRLIVPTLDVDLAWHTHQLSPSAYYAYTKAVTKKFVRHDDKVDEDDLHDGFERTSKIYQEKYGEVYSECTCWYCESVRMSHISSIGKVFGISSNDKIDEKFHSSGFASFCPPDNSAHISSHNAVKLGTNDESVRQRVRAHIQAAQQHRLEENYAKACKRAEKKGRKLPPREQYYEHWGYTYYMYGPWMYPMYFAPGMYYASPGYAGAGGGSCASGSCGGGVAAGACGSAGGCAGGCSGGDGGGGCGGGGGGCGGGGCGGGGGGGCGGGGS
ncbi:hypothetical protein B0J13DRAFT_527345 [Dactylonectria estremocensis]|uniref:Glycine-rich domain-containing protein 1 n=1 Tax=Dactylonectria estremocensis TaxID=1079267 RepID=A0A9P9J2G8_9HYPO|nr:hypothetical protein B0J13DRAFT_527345 [Dactylonectria estremocensis]